MNQASRIFKGSLTKRKKDAFESALDGSNPTYNSRKKNRIGEGRKQYIFETPLTT